MNNAQQEWEIGLSSWIIQDGNYGDFETGQNAEFALEFYSQNFRKTHLRSKSCKKLGAAKYAIVGEIIYLTDEVWVLDFGICAFQESKPPEGIRVGDFIAAEIYLGIDPFFYFERLYTLPKIPALIYSWKINSIGQQTAPFIETREPSGQKVLIRDENKLGYKIIGKTDAWKDDAATRSMFLPAHFCPFLRSSRVRLRHEIHLNERKTFSATWRVEEVSDADSASLRAPNR
ncbi:MAG: hypothetical protein L0Y58_04840 [Verrucomicrobia subdivision 3 bacterium]|nr:hypothetical protein [Limisphaerales bacterium]